MIYSIKRNHVLIILVITFLLFVITSVNASNKQLVTETIAGDADEFIYLPLINKNFDGSLGTPMFGTQMYGNTSTSSPYHSALVESNTTWLRTRVNWNSVEPERLNPVAYNWASADATLAAARSDMGEYKLIVTVETAPSWAAPSPEKPLNPVGVNAYVQFVQALVERYDGDGIADAPGSPVVLHWEIYNEPDSNKSWGNDGDKFAAMLKQVYPAVKSANPYAKVVFPGLAYDWFDDQGGVFVRSFLPDVLANDVGNYFDIMNFHSYPSFAPSWTQNSGPGLREKASAIRNVMNSYGVQKPMVVTEAAWYSNDVVGSVLPGTPEVQARFVVELFTQSMAADIDVMIWWPLYDIGHLESGLITNTENPNPLAKKLAFTTYQKVIEKLGTAHFVRKFSDAETGDSKMEAYQFVDNVYNRDMYVAWMNPIDTNVTKSLKIAAAEAIVWDAITGNFVQLVTDGNDGQLDGRITVTVGVNPIYVEVRK